LLSKSKKSVYELQWLLDDLLKNRENATKTIVYCRNIASCATLYEHFSLHLPQSEILSERLIAMFHRSTAQLNKAYVLKEFPKNDSVLRILFATVAFGMGVDIPDVEQVVHWGAPRGLEQVVHWGAPRGLEQVVQGGGRAGRDGRHSLSCIYYSGHDIAKGKSTDEMREFCKSTKCVRELMNR
jgi:superfamily II DNA helicase RecQ